MKQLKKQRRIQIIVIAFVALAVSTALIGYALRDGINLFRSPSQVAEAPPPSDEIFNLGGLVVDGSIGAPEGMHFSFVVTDGGAEIPVRYVGEEPRPDLFGEGQGTVATGRYIDGVFQATRLLAKHDETYMPAEVVDALKEQGVFKPPEG